MNCRFKKTVCQWDVAILSALMIALTWTSIGNAAGLLIADGGFGGVLEIKEHDVKVVVNNGIAVTHVTQVFHNTENRQVEALYTFPVPKGASVANFSMWINGKEMVGEVLEKERARQIYNSYKRTRKDPGLLEQVNYKTFEMRIFPIGPGADQRVQISYYQELEVDHDRAVYVYPLASSTRKDVDSRTTGKFAIDFEVKSAIPVTVMESPSHGGEFVIVDHSEHYKQASLEAQGGSLARDVVVAFDLARPQTGMDLLTSRTGGEDGYFCLTLTAGKELAEKDTGMDYVFLLDISGSMANDRKLSVSRNSVDAFIDELGAGDRFEVMTFNVKPDTAFQALRDADEDAKSAARTYMAAQRARGGTTLAPAMLTAYDYGTPDRTLNVVVLSDGMTEQEERQTLMNLIASRPSNTRVFCIGIGNEVNRPLLEQMADEAGGLAAFVSNGDDFQRQAKAFRRKLTRPVAADIQIDFTGVKVYDLAPERFPNLYHGAPVKIYGRYSGSGDADITLTAFVQGAEIRQNMQMNFPAEDADNPELERMWAWKRVDQLLKSADKSGSRASVRNEVIRLGEDYSIVTEYTSFLVLENDAEYQRWKIERRNLRRLETDRAAQSRRNTVMDRIRGKVLADLGPANDLQKVRTPTPAAEPQVTQPQTGQPAQPAPAVTPQPVRRRQSTDFNLNFGSGPVGPLFIGLVWWLRRRKQG